MMWADDDGEVHRGQELVEVVNHVLDHFGWSGQMKALSFIVDHDDHCVVQGCEYSEFNYGNVAVVRARKTTAFSPLLVEVSQAFETDILRLPGMTDEQYSRLYTDYVIGLCQDPFSITSTPMSFCRDTNRAISPWLHCEQLHDAVYGVFRSYNWLRTLRALMESNYGK